MCDPDFVELVVGEWDHGEAIRAYSCPFESESYHRYSFASGEGVVERVAVLSAAYDDYQFVDSFQNILDCSEVAYVKGLEATDVEAGGQSVAFGWVPKHCCIDLILVDWHCLTSQQFALRRTSTLSKSSAH